MSLPQEERNPDRLAGIVAFILKPAGILLACAIGVAVPVGMYWFGVRVGEKAITFEQETVAGLAAQRTKLLAENKIISDRLKNTEDRLKRAEDIIEKERSADKEYVLRSNETFKIAGFPTIIGMVGTSIASIATLSFDNTKLQVKVGDKFTTRVGSVDACEVTVRAVDVFSVKLRADCKTPPQN